MYIVRWLMGHPIIATWVLAAVAILLTLSSGNKSDKEETSVVKVESSAAESLKGIKADISSKLDDSKIISKPVLDEESVTEEIAREATAVTTDLKQPEEAPFGATSKKDNIEVKAKLEKDSEQNIKSTAVADLGQSSTEEMLLMAREAYWNNGLDEAAQIYEKLIEVEPKVLEHRGELGNVYWRQGYPKKAAELYSEIAIPMIEQGNKERVANMIGFIGLFYPDRAAEIHKKIQLKK